MSLAERVSRHPAMLYVAYIFISLSTYFMAVQVWSKAGFFSTIGVSDVDVVVYKATYVANILISPWIVALVQAAGAWIGARANQLECTFRRLFSVAAASYMVVWGLQNGLLNLLRLFKGPIVIHWGLGAIGIGSPWVDKVTNVFLFIQMFVFASLFFSVIAATRRQQQMTNAGFTIGAVIAIVLV